MLKISNGALMEHDATRASSAKHVCIVSPEEDFRLRLAVLLASTCHIESCNDWDSMIDIAHTHDSMIAIVDSTLWRYRIGEMKRAIEELIIDHPVYVVRLYPYQLQGELVEHALEYHVDSIWMQKILFKKPGVEDFMAAIYKCLSSSGNNMTSAA